LGLVSHVATERFSSLVLCHLGLFVNIVAHDSESHTGEAIGLRESFDFFAIIRKKEK
jgi:hypothetical protein